jgi:hypothetical protein
MRLGASLGWFRRRGGVSEIASDSCIGFRRRSHYFNRRRKPRAIDPCWTWLKANCLLLVCAFALTVGVPLAGIEARAQEPAARQPAATQVLQAVSFDMPRGASAAAAPSRPVELPRPRIPIGNAALSRLRNQPGALGALTQALESKTPPLPTISTNCQANSANGYTPSDIIGAVGPANFVVTTNVEVGVYSKSDCSQVSLATLSAFFGGVSGETLFDPQVLWDYQNSRFIVTAESEFSGNANQNQYFAISKDSTGTSWWVYHIALINGSSTFCVPNATAFWDYQKVGSVNGSNPQWMITANVFPSGAPDDDAATPAGATDTASLLAITKAPSLTGGAVTINCFINFQFNLIPPNVTDSNNTAYLLSPGSGSGSSILRYALNPNNTVTTTSAISILSWTAAPLVAQPNGQVLDPLDGRFESHSIQNGTNIWNVHNIAYASVGLIRAYQFDTSATSPVNTVTLTTTSTSNPTDNLFNASIATNGTQAFISVSRTIPSVPTSGNAAMLILNGPNTLVGSWSADIVATSSAQFSIVGSAAEPNVLCNNSQRGSCRWGDYSAIQIDPSNSSTAWGFNELITGNTEFNWTTLAALSSQQQTTYTISVSASPPAGGTVSGNGTFPAGSSQTVTATANSGYSFANWTENGTVVSTSASYPFTLNANRTLVANFIQNFTLSVNVTGSGTVTSSPAGINCSSPCSASFTSGAQVSLTATPASGWSFAGWGGACGGAGACSVTMNAAQSVSAAFSQIPTTGTVAVNATYNGQAWSGAVNYNLSGAASIGGNNVPASFPNQTAGTYTLSYVSGGPAGAALSTVTPSTIQTLNAGQSITYTLNFTTSVSSGTWSAVAPAPVTGLSNPLLLTDGTVIVHIWCSQSWYRLTPDIQGNYATGTWSQIASLPSGYDPLYFASAVLPDGRVIMQGGEYNSVGCSGGEVWTNLGAIYDPVANAWTSVSPPSGSSWSRVGDAASIVLPNGTFMLSSCCANPPTDALFNAATLAYTPTGAPANYQDEQGYTLLPTGNVLTIDVWNPNATQLYNPNSGAWSAGTSTPVSLIDPTQCNKSETGPAVTRPDGTTVAFGGNTGCTSSPADPTAIYTASSNSWVQGPNVPAVCGANGTTSCTLADAPAALLPNGNILFAASAGYGNAGPPTHFFEFTGANTINQVADPPFNPSNLGSYNYNLLVLPNGQIFMTDFGNVAGVYTPSGSANAAWAPVITSVPTNLAPGQTYQINGSQLNGLSQGAAYGDDVQAATNYPLVQITNNATGHVFYARTFNHSTMSIAANTAASTNFTVPGNVETGANSLVVVANGIASQPIPVNISNSSVLTVNVTGSGTVTSNPPGINCTSTCNAGFSNGTNVTLTATATSGWVFSGWSGACGGAGGCTVTMSTAQSVTATFTQLSTLAVNITGSGTVTSSPAGISCSSNCSASFASGTQVTLTATAAGGWKFNGWSGACSGTGTCSVTMNSAQSVTATFVQLTYPLAVSLTGSGSVTSNPSGITCPSACNASFNSGTQVTLTATPAGSMSFIGWAGACSGTGSCSVTMSAAESVSAAFTTGGDPPNSRTWVSGASGSDSNPCTRVAPCLTFAAALAQTPAGGEIDVIDPGDFGPVTITKSVSIYGDAPGVAGLIPFPGTSGIVISAGSSDVINLHGLVFDGVNASGTSGVVFTSGARLNVNQCVFQGFTTSGMTLSPGVGGANTTLIAVQNTTILSNATGILIQPAGGIAANVRLRRLHIDHNFGDGLRVDGTGGSGAINVAITDSSANFNAGNGIDAVSGPGNAAVDVMRIVAASNGSAGIQANQTSGGIASVTVGSSLLRKNAIGIQATGGAGLLSFGDNHVTGNASNGSFTGGATSQ